MLTPPSAELFVDHRIAAGGLIAASSRRTYWAASSFYVAIMALLVCTGAILGSNNFMALTCNKVRRTLGRKISMFAGSRPCRPSVMP